ncbi:coiled-coil-helix-coiled-coil-helix domain-containing protein 1 [Fundulus heteroclitus]|uniref:Coiled-coil-helix-coiled-coil-helix domain containing 1 n=1 Tax=Fundulus heteroclitus TaxID=8078 RepID=A0A3Q2PCT4_FUNHE|nr:coiled-coil-helix-coiled-coil-helix domain-containing protein 1 [Fundulus heteroclitus]
MAAQGGAPFLEKVNKLLCRQNGKPVLKPNRPLVLKECVANRKPKKGEATCITEMSVLMACWKQNNFVDGLCSNEIHSFYTCVQNAQAAMKKSKQGDMTGGRLSAKQATTLLKRFPNLRSEI